MNQRLKMLKKLVAQGSPDPFHRYALALEYKRLDHPDEALATFEALRTAHPQYLPMYMQTGQLLAQLDRIAQARVWFDQGLAVARQQGDLKTAGELQDALKQTEEK